jgi:hypothetical protein
MKLPRNRIAAAALLAFALSGCAGATRVATATLGAGLGGAAGNVLSDGDPLLTAAGAAGGVLLSETLNYASDSRAKKAALEGYNKGRSDAVKQQYWIMENQQRAALNITEEISLYDIPLPEQEIDGVILNPRTATLRIQE